MWLFIVFSVLRIFLFFGRLSLEGGNIGKLLPWKFVFLISQTKNLSLSFFFLSLYLLQTRWKACFRSRPWYNFLRLKLWKGMLWHCEKLGLFFQSLYFLFTSSIIFFFFFFSLLPFRIKRFNKLLILLFAFCLWIRASLEFVCLLNFIISIFSMYFLISVWLLGTSWCIERHHIFIGYIVFWRRAFLSCKFFIRGYPIDFFRFAFWV